MSNPTPKFGKVVETETLDKEGSTLSTETNYQNGLVRKPRWRHVEYRIRVTNAKEEMIQYLKFCDEKVDKSSSMWRTENTKAGDAEGWYYCIKSWSEVVKES